MDPWAFISSANTGNWLGPWYPPNWPICKFMHEPLPEAQEHAIRRAYSEEFIWRMAVAVPKELYLISRVCLAILYCHYAQRTGTVQEIRLAKYRVNYEAIKWAKYSVEGWAIAMGSKQAKLGIPGHTVALLGYRVSHHVNDFARRRFGYPNVENGSESPVDYGVFRAALWTRIRMIMAYTKTLLALAFLYAAEKLGTQRFKIRLQNDIEEYAEVLQHDMDASRLILAMAFPCWGSEQVATGVEWVKEKLAYISYELLDGKDLSSICTSKLLEKITELYDNVHLEEVILRGLLLSTVTLMVTLLLGAHEPTWISLLPYVPKGLASHILFCGTVNYSIIWLIDRFNKPNLGKKTDPDDYVVPIS